MEGNETILSKLSKELKATAANLKDAEARHLVNAYYIMQSDRIRADAQIRSLTKEENPHELVGWLSDQSAKLEQNIKGMLQVYVENHMIGPWLLAIDGIGPVTSAGLLAHIDINKAPTVGHIWSFAGIDKGKLDKVWEKGQKRPWNADLRVLCYKIGEGFVKVCNKETATYGRLYKERKLKEIEQNSDGYFKDFAEAYLEKYKFGKTTEAYKAYSIGQLPPAHLHARARRHAVKIFLSHLHQRWREKAGLSVPEPYVIKHMGHVHLIPAPPLL